ncbi:hypothetical protein STEG23_010785, partial [Scotinomys teguina]
MARKEGQGEEEEESRARQQGEEDISSPIRMQKVPPQIMNISSDVTVNEGSSVTLLCLAIGRPEPTVTWRHLSVKGFPESGGVEFDGSTLFKDECSEISHSLHTL